MGEPRLAVALRRLLALPSWCFLGAVLGSIALLVLGSALVPAFYDGFVGPYLWEPILFDEGYNPVNTVLLVAYALLAVGWFFALLREYGETMDATAATAAVLFYAWGSLLRVLEDADYFAPYQETVADHGLPATSACAPAIAGSLVDQCLGLFFITPILWIWAGVLLFLLARLGLAAQRVAQRAGPAQGLRFVGLALVGSLALSLAAWAYAPAWVRMVAPPWYALPLHALAYLFVHWRARSDGVRWASVLLAFGIVLLGTAAYPVGRWFVLPPQDWGPETVTRPWIVGALVLAVGVLMLSVRAMAQVRGRRPAGSARSVGPGRFGYLLVLVAFACFASILGIARTVEGPRASWLGTMLLVLAGPVVALACVGAVRHVTGPVPGPGPGRAVFARAGVLLMIGAQAADAYMTGLGLDVFGALEKHLVPRTLIEWFDRLGAPGPFGDYPATTVMILYKVPITLAIAWILEARIRPALPRAADLLWLLQLAVVSVGLGPALRNALRLAMGV